jgi:adenosylcobinamide kinase / adenosylcobinamide-phosphate guanylyltransferase
LETDSRPDLPHLTFVLGGGRSGKSRYAEQLVMAAPSPWIYIATAEAYDEEMRDRIATHQLRRGQGWETVESPISLPEAIADASQVPMLVDCLSMWVSNLMLGDRDLPGAFKAFDDALAKRTAPTVLVSNEVGLSIVPDNALGRAFRDELGVLNQRVAARAARVIFMVAGLPMVVKGSQ